MERGEFAWVVMVPKAALVPVVFGGPKTGWFSTL
jgi:hypothetical protein